MRGEPILDRLRVTFRCNATHGSRAAHPHERRNREQRTQGATDDELPEHRAIFEKRQRCESDDDRHVHGVHAVHADHGNKGARTMVY